MKLKLPLRSEVIIVPLDSPGLAVDNAFHIGTWLVQPNLNTVSRNGTTVRLEPKVMAVLVCLARRGGDPVSKKEILDTVWQGTFVSDDVLSRSISELRRVLHDDARQPQFIETIPKRGYRLMMPVAQVGGSPIASVPKPARNRRTGLSILGGAVLLTAVLFAVWRFLQKPQGALAIRSIAVLPLKSISKDPAQNYFAYGMTDELITVLSHIHAIKVISHTSVLRYEGTTRPLPDIARELNVDAVVEGTVQRSGDRLLITVQLIDARSDKHIWAESYDREVSDVLGMEGEVATQIAHAIQVRLTSQEHVRLRNVRPINPKALDAYLTGRHHLRISIGEELRIGQEARSQAEFRQAVADFEEAIREDPKYTAAYLALFDALDSPQTPHLDLLPRAKAAVEQALARDDNLPQAHADLARIRMLYEYKWDWTSVGNELERAVQLNPSLPGPHYVYGDYLQALGRSEEAQQENKVAHDLDPDCRGFNDDPLGCFGDESRVDQLRRYLEETNSDNIFQHGAVAKELQATGRYDEAIQEWEKTLELSGNKHLADSLADANVNQGYRGALQILAAGLEAEATHTYVPRIALAQSQIAVGNKDRAFFWLEKAYEEHNWCMLYLTMDPGWAPLRSDARFTDLVRRVGLPQ